MTSQKRQNEPEKQAHERLAEIGRILYAGIKRLKVQELSKNRLNQLDSTAKMSVHTVNLIES